MLEHPLQAGGALVAGGAVIAIALWTDLRHRRIPNLLTVPAAICALCFHTAVGGITDGTLFSLKGLLIGIALLLIPFLLGGMGGGDVKLFGGLGAWLGVRSVIIVSLLAAVAGGIIALVMLIRHGGFARLRGVWRDIVALIITRERVEPDTRSRRLPFSVPTAMGYILFLTGRFAGWF